ncbi:fasciclin domain-containing protein [Cellulomonas fengjieae]|uniref:Fasciclin domain-containing protein n=1 Tax=Cellulomonas fengjieae TaxID=2819978 RepID=A0ABS3SC10_9CELL|nr:fasciclin domain-containing protein [Cellulomonas fengjieae]MBO3083289.1 fasciclin domain-containing protein [Cellulomonas fengjieae]MBO3101963.1 fasciclin domain-containing protein [Cellulomonas fengjieae]QVI65361.1 fasciclin domain-containing protein [Cellulomonas fengjieae]
MRIRRTLSALLATGLVGAGAALAPSASAAPTGTSSLAALLASDGDTFDRSWRDFDILDQAVGAVLAAKPTSPVAVLADGTVPLTAFLPNDRAFQFLAKDLTHRWYGSEEQVLTALAGAVGIDAIEQVLLYHVVPGATIDSGTALASDNADLTTAQGGTFRVDVISKRFGVVQLRDQDRNDLNPFLVPGKLDLNAGNVQIAHGITAVLRPADL